MQINSDFESGNIVVDTSTDTEATLRIRPDTNAQFYQWFYFKVTGTPGMSRTFTFANAGKSSYPVAWNGYQVLASYDEVDWFRVPTHYDGTQVVFVHTAREETTSYAFFIPYTAARRAALLKEAAAAPNVSRRSIGQSVQGQALDTLVFGDESRAVKKVWIVCRQHAGEPMAEWATEGLIRRLLDSDDTVAQTLLEKATFYIVPNINPDGSAAGNLRANSNGVDLNRAWAAPGEDAPEIIAVRKAIAETGIDFFLDMHGDEERPFIWIAHPGVELSPEVAKVQRQFEQELMNLNPEVRPAPASEAGTLISPGLSANYIVSTYNCPAWITELPFKDVGDLGETPDSMLLDGCIRFGRTCLDALLAVMD